MEAAAIAAARLEGHDHDAHESKTVQPDLSEPGGKENRLDPGTGAAASKNPDHNKHNAAPASGAKDDAKEGKAENTSVDQRANAKKANRREKRATEKADASGNDIAITPKSDNEDLNVVTIRVGITQPDAGYANIC